MNVSVPTVNSETGLSKDVERVLERVNGVVPMRKRLEPMEMGVPESVARGV